MNDTPDHELLRCYAEHGAEEAFAELVERHIDLVWAAGWRVSGDRELARDVAQTVFTDLARKADKLPPGTVLAGWLYRAACHAAAKHIRGENRRAQRERQAMQQNELRSGDAEARAAAELQPVLDAALADLTETDRDAVVLRFLAGRSLAEVGATLGTNEDAAQKRVSRALEKLREAFRQRGVAVSGGIVAAALGVAGTQAAPAGLAGVIATASLAGAGAAAWGTFSVVTLMKSKLALGIVGGVVVATTLAWQQRNVTRLADENAGLRQQAAAQPVPSAAPVAAEVEELTRLRGEHAELLRLRGEMTALRRGQTEASAPSVRLVKSPALELGSQPQRASGEEFTLTAVYVPVTAAAGTPPAADRVVPRSEQIKAVQIGHLLQKELFRDAGDLSPTNLVETVLWTAKVGNYRRFSEILSEASDALPLDNRDEAKKRMLDRISRNLEATDKVEMSFMTSRGEHERQVTVRLAPNGSMSGPSINFQLQQEGRNWRVMNLSTMSVGKP